MYKKALKATRNLVKVFETVRKNKKLLISSKKPRKGWCNVQEL